MEEGYVISTEKDKLDLAFIHSYLSEESYWARGRTEAMVRASIENSRCYGLYDGRGVQLAFARIVTDYTIFAWLMDVFVSPGYQKNGIGKMLMGHIMADPLLQGVRGMGLRTEDAHGLYEKFGFRPLQDAEKWMFNLRSSPDTSGAQIEMQ